MKVQFFRFLNSLSQMFNVLLGFIPSLRSRGFGSEDETTSSVLGKIKHKCKTCRFICKVLDLVFMTKKHCQGAIEVDEGTSNKD